MHNNSDTVFFSVFFDGIQKYIPEFLTSLEKQSNKDFDVLIINESIQDIDNYLKNRNLTFHVVNYIGTIAENRAYGLSQIINAGYKYVIFGDADDTFATNRVKIVKDKLKKYQIVVNDLDILSNNKIIKQKCFSNRIKNNTIINIDFIKDKNIFGLSNTGVLVELLNDIRIPPDIKVVDWYLFSRLLLKTNGLFTNETTTQYRQHDNNFACLDERSNLKKILKTIQIKKEHYFYLKEFDNKFDTLYNYYDKLCKIKNYSFELNKINYPFWWEEI